MEILGIIPARYSSSRFPGKPLAMINGKTMIQRVYEQVQKSTRITDTIVATDDIRIYQEVISFGGEAMLTSTTHQNGSSRCYEVFEKKNEERPDFYEAVVNIQGDEPYINPIQIDQVCDILIENDAEISTLAKRLYNDDLFDPNTVKVVFGKSGHALYFSRNPIPFQRSHKKEEWLNHASYYKHIGIYGFTTDALERINSLKPSRLELNEGLEQLRWLENDLKINVDITEFESFGIDTPEDLEKLINII